MIFITVTLVSGLQASIADHMISAFCPEAPAVIPGGELLDKNCVIYLTHPLRFPGTHEDLWAIPVKETYNQVSEMLQEKTEEA